MRNIIVVLLQGTTHTKWCCYCIQILELGICHIQCSGDALQTKDIATTVYSCVWKCLSNNFWHILVSDGWISLLHAVYLKKFHASPVGGPSLGPSCNWCFSLTSDNVNCVFAFVRTINTATILTNYEFCRYANICVLIVTAAFKYEWRL